jgi:hypothetical protein
MPALSLGLKCYDNMKMVLRYYEDSEWITWSYAVVVTPDVFVSHQVSPTDRPCFFSNIDEIEVAKVPKICGASVKPSCVEWRAPLATLNLEELHD